MLITSTLKKKLYILQILTRPEFGVFHFIFEELGLEEIMTINFKHS